MLIYFIVVEVLWQSPKGNTKRKCTSQQRSKRVRKLQTWLTALFEGFKILNRVLAVSYICWYDTRTACNPDYRVGNACCITGSLWRGSTIHQLFASQRANNAQVWCFLVVSPNNMWNKQSSCQLFETLCCSYNLTLMHCPKRLRKSFTIFLVAAEIEILSNTGPEGRRLGTWKYRQEPE